MTLIRRNPRLEVWDPFASLTELHNEVNRLAGFRAGYTPAVDVVVDKDNVVAKADLPGLTKDDVTVTLEDNYLTIKGEKKNETEHQEGDYFVSERVYGSFARTIELPVPVDAKKIEAHFKDGVLRVTLPKSEEAKPKQIDIKVD